MNTIYSGALQVVHEVGFLWLLPFFPFVGAALNGLAGPFIERRLGRHAVSAIAIACMMAATVVAVVAVIGFLLPLPPGERFLLDTRWQMIAVGAVKVNLAFAMDPLSATLVLVVTVIGTLIHVYSAAYMATDTSYARYFCYLNLFVAAMLVLVLADSFLLMFFGWEGVGLCSYLLIGFWYDDREKTRAGTQAFVVNRVGDWGLLGGMLLLFWGLGGGWDGSGGFSPDTVGQVMVDVPRGGAEIELRTQGERPRQASLRNVPVGPTLVFRELGDQLSIRNDLGERPFAEKLQAKRVWGVPLVLLVCLGLFLGAAGKSAQIPLQAWLPEAMAGPTPVSALIHAATMVTAGVYLIARLSFLFALSPGAMMVVAAVGVTTALVAATIGTFQHDIKRILAFSTVSQLGFMFLGVGVGAYGAGVVHLVTHACFKACLFLAAGAIIHALDYLEHDAEAHAHPLRDARLIPSRADPQDVRNMGGLASLMPRTRRAYFIACLAIAGFPVASGFYSREAILWGAFSAGGSPILAGVLWAAAFLAAGLTSFYMFRSYYLIFHARRPSIAQRINVHEAPRTMTAVLAVLAVASIVVGPLLAWPSSWGGHAYLEAFLAPVFSAAGAAPGIAGPRTVAWALQLTTVAIALLGWMAARACFVHLGHTGKLLEWVRRRWDPIHRMVYRQHGADSVYRELAVLPALDFSRYAAWLDARVVDRGVNLMGRASAGLARLGGKADSVILDGTVDGISTLMMAGGRKAARLQTGRINTYVLMIVVGVVALVALAFLLEADARAAGPDPAVPAPRLIITPTSLSFDQVGQSHDVTLRNVGSAPLHLGAPQILIPGTRATTDFTIDPAGPRELAPGQTLVIHVGFRPLVATVPKQIFAALLLSADDPSLRPDIGRRGAPAQDRRVAGVALRVGSTQLLSWIIFFPLFGIPIVLLLPRGRESLARWVALLAAAVPLGLAIRLMLKFDPTFSVSDGNYGLQFVEHIPWIRAFNVEYFLGVDGLSVTMVLLTALVSLVAVGASWSIPVERHIRGYFSMFLLLEVGMMGVFCAADFFLFYVFWGVMLLPMYFLIGIWGGPRKEYAAIKFFLYTMAGAVLLLLAIIALYFTSSPTYLVDGTPAAHTFDLMKLAYANDFGDKPALLGFAFSKVVWIALFIGFAIKIPLVPFHTWLPDAHVEAPTAISAILAGVLLKMGTYGMMRVSWPILPEATRWAADAVAVFATINIVYGALCAMAQTDLKKLVAYSSISHMGFCLLGMAALTPTGMNGAVMQMFSHGVITTMLFLLVGVIHDRTQTRALADFGGLATVMPRYAAFFGLAFMASLGLPGLSGFIGEALVLLGAFAVHRVATLVAAASLVITAAYHLWTIERMQLGALPERWRSLAGHDVSGREVATLLPLALVVVVLGFYPVPVLSTIAVGVQDLLRLVNLPGGASAIAALAR